MFFCAGWFTSVNLYRYYFHHLFFILPMVLPNWKLQFWGKSIWFFCRSKLCSYWVFSFKMMLWSLDFFSQCFGWFENKKCTGCFSPVLLARPRQKRKIYFNFTIPKHLCYRIKPILPINKTGYTKPFKISPSFSKFFLQNHRHAQCKKAQLCFPHILQQMFSHFHFWCLFLGCFLHTVQPITGWTHRFV